VRNADVDGKERVCERDRLVPATGLVRVPRLLHVDPAPVERQPEAIRGLDCVAVSGWLQDAQKRGSSGLSRLQLGQTITTEA
jgi:hypothetical protein